MAQELSGLISIDECAAAAWKAAQPVLDEIINGAHIALTGLASDFERQHFTHRLRHHMLHAMYDELVADFLIHRKEAMPSTATVAELMHWSNRQRESATADPPASNGASGNPEPASDLTH